MAIIKNTCGVWMLLFLFGFSLGCYLGESDVVTGYYGGSITLPCICEDLQNKSQIIIWEIEYEYDAKPVYEITDGQPKVHKDYDSRVALDDGSPDDFSLIIYNLTEKDAGTYRCGREYSNSFVNLEVKDCDLFRSGERWGIHALSGDSILLPCWCTEKAKPRTFTWRDPNGRLIKSYSEESGHFARRIWPIYNKWMWNMSMYLHYVTIDDEGEYTCEINNKAKVVITLTVTDCILVGSYGKDVKAPLGSSILLPCACSNLEAKPKNFRWIPPNGRELDWHYRGRAQLFNHIDAVGNLSLALSNLMVEDEGVYRCEAAEGKFVSFLLTISDTSHDKLANDKTEAEVLENLQHLIIFMLAVLILLLITHITLGAMIIRWRKQGAAPSPCVQYSM